MIAVVLLAALSAYDYATNSLAARIDGVTPPACLSRFADYPPNALLANAPLSIFQGSLFKPNPKFWLKDVDFSCASPWNSMSGTTRAGTAISKRHIVFANHFALAKGTRILFVGRDGGVCPCRLEASKRIGKSDLVVGLLDAELTPNIVPAKILPPDCEKYIGDGAGLPVVTFNRQEKAYLTDLRAIAPKAQNKLLGSLPPKEVRHQALREPISSGDSGNPAFLLVGKEAILLYCLQRAACGPDLHLYAGEIQKAMDELCPGYRLECFDFEALTIQL